MSKPEPTSDGPLVWIDCEMTGLNPSTDHLLEISCLITTATLHPLHPPGFTAILSVPSHLLTTMSPWCQNTHTATGLTAAVLASTTTEEEAAADLLTYIKKYIPEKGTGLLAGNSVYADRAFLMRGPFKEVVEWLHYRILDVSSIKEVARRWGAPGVLEGAPRKTGVHRAREDILESIEEARYYRDVIFKR